MIQSVYCDVREAGFPAEWNSFSAVLSKQNIQLQKNNREEVVFFHFHQKVDNNVFVSCEIMSRLFLYQGTSTSNLYFSKILSYS